VFFIYRYMNHLENFNDYIISNTNIPLTSYLNKTYQIIELEEVVEDCEYLGEKEGYHFYKKGDKIFKSKKKK
jgi:hypothetical protein